MPQLLRFGHNDRSAKSGSAGNGCAVSGRRRLVNIVPGGKIFLSFVVCAGLWGCDEDAELIPPPVGFDASTSGPLDADLERPDAARDASPVDSSAADALEPDAEPLDVEAPDLSTPDADPLDADLGDALSVDEGLPDVGAPDMTLPDMSPDAEPPRELDCADGEDNDGDGVADCADRDCIFAAFCFDAREICDNGVDDNADGHVDCDDVTCHDAPACPVPDVPAFDEAELQALFDARCVPCHFTDPPSAQLSLAAPFEPALIDVASSQTPLVRVKPGDRESSYLYHKMRFSHLDAPGGGGDGMPPLDRLTAAQIERLGRWIDGL